MRRKCTMRPDRGLPDTLRLVANARELKFYSKYNEKMGTNFNRMCVLGRIL